MNAELVRKHIKEVIDDTLKAKGLEACELTDETLVFGGDLEIDSLDLAGIVVNLSERCKKDPFALGFVEFHTVGDLVKLYAD